MFYKNLTIFTIVTLSSNTLSLKVDKTKCNDSDNEMWYELGPGCPQTCDNLNRKCYNFTIYPPGCYCKPGYVVDIVTNKCVFGNEYCGNCKKSEYYTISGPKCERLCGHLNEPCESENEEREITKGGCYCDDGFARTKSGKCVFQKYCNGELNRFTNEGRNNIEEIICLFF